MADVDFRVVHTDHNNNTISTHYPTGDALRWSYKASDVGDIGYALSLDDDAILATLAENSFAPYKTDWRLGMSVNGGGWESIHAGIHTAVQLSPRSGVANVSGRDWTHWLEQPVWFEFYETQFTQNDLKDIVAQWSLGVKDVDLDANGYYENFAVRVWSGPDGATQQSVIRDLLEASFQGPNSTDPVIITPSFNSAAGWNEILSYFIQVQDETNILDHIKTVGALSDPYGFDFTMNWNKVMEFFGPRKSVGSSPDPIWTLSTDNVVIDTVPDFDWTNNGPVGTYMVGLGPGSPALWRLKFDQETIDLYRQWLRLVRVGDNYAGKLTGVRYATAGLQYGFPHKDLRLSIYPNKMDAFDVGDGFRNHVGDVVRFKWEVPPYHTINAYFWITQQDYHGDAANNWVCDLGLEQIYAS